MRIPWHRAFGLTLEDYFTNTCYEVELEMDLAKKQQFLDVAVVRKAEGPEPENLCSGFEQLREHNLITFKSANESLNEFAILELIGHYVNYCKNLGESRTMSHVALFAVTAHFPRNVFQKVAYREQSTGVYLFGELKPITVIVTSQIPKTKENAIWLLYSFKEELARYGVENYHWRKDDHTTVSRVLNQHFEKEGWEMAYTIKDFHRDYVLPTYTAEERLRGLDSREVFSLYKPEERLKGIAPEERLKGLTPEQKKALLKQLSEEQLDD